MQSATPPGTGAMAAILGLDDEILATVCEQAAQGGVVSCANYNSPGQIVIAGDQEAVKRACELSLEAGAMRAIPLAVSVPSHCALMKPAAVQLAVELQAVTCAAGSLPVVHNVDVLVHTQANQVRDALVQQLWQPVRWSATIQDLMAKGVMHFAECGPGKVLTGLNRRISREITGKALITREDLSTTLEAWS